MIAVTERTPSTRISPATEPAHERAPQTAGERGCVARGLRLALAGGGTGGHLVPGLHLLASARDAAPTDSIGASFDDVVWFTSTRAVEERVLARLADHAGNVPVERVELALEPAGGGAPSRTGLVLRTPAAVMRARERLVAHQSEVLLALGGFAGLPAVLAARSLGIPVALLELNACPGAATRWLSRFAARVFHAWPASARTFPGAAHLHTGPPLAPEFTRGAPPSEFVASARRELGFDPERPLLVILGGSQGASALNRFACAHAPAIVASGVQVLHQTGPARAQEGLPEFSGYRALEYVDPAWSALAAATVVLCRGGASTLAEVAALSRPAIVVPYPHHPDRHQEKNALELGDGVRIVPEERLSVSARQELIELCDERGTSTRDRMSVALRAALPRDACERIRTELRALAQDRAVRADRVHRATRPLAAATGGDHAAPQDPS